MKGRVLRSTGSFYNVLGENGTTYVCKIRGKLRLEGIRETNPVAVGDNVLIEVAGDTGAITEILPRINHMLRQSVKKTAHAHVLGANIDQAMLVATVALPRTSLGFIDRFLVSAEAFRIPQALIFNKSDLLDDEAMQTQHELVQLYTAVGVRTMSISALQDDLREVAELMKGKITLLAGHSGVGKSTLLNRIVPGINQRTADVSQRTEKGMHTTTFAEMFAIDENTFVIDTPGVKEWGLIDMNEQEISDYFPEMRERRTSCRFGSRCIHAGEPGCAIAHGVSQGEIALSRYESYLSMLAGEDNRR